MVHFMEYHEDVIEYVKLGGLINGIQQEKEHGTVLVSSVLVFGIEVNMTIF